MVSAWMGASRNKHKKGTAKNFVLIDYIFYRISVFIQVRGYADKIQTFEQRKKNIINYLESLGYNDNFEIIEISDCYGPTISNDEIDAIVVSKDTLPTAIEITRWVIKASEG